MGVEHLDYLIEIAENNGLFASYQTTTSQLSKKLSTSQQTVSRNLIEMENQGLIERKVNLNGIELKLTKKSIQLLENLNKRLNSLFNRKSSVLKGIVTSGIGEGRYYVSLPQYQKKFKELLGLLPFAGTLNLKVNLSDLAQFIHNLENIEIPSFSTKERTFGSITCYKVKIKNIDAAIIMPERTRHEKDIIEIIAPFYLRSKLHLKDNSEVLLEK